MRYGWTLALGCFLLASPAAAQNETVRIYNWSDYIDPTLIDEFTAETGIDVVYDVYDNNNILETKLLAGNSGYDLVVPSGYFLARQLQAGVFQKLDRSKLTNWENLDKGLMDEVAKYDPGNEHAAIYMWGTTGLAYNVEEVTKRLGGEVPASGRLVFDPAVASKLADCGIYFLDSPDDVLPAALRYIGEDPNSKDADVLGKAADVLMSVRPNVRKFHSSESINALASGDICVALMYSGDAGIAATRAEEAGNGIEITYKIPEEGAQLWFDLMAIPADAPNPDAAHRFIDYMLRPEVIARASNFVTYPNANVKAEQLIDPEVRADPDLYPTAEIKKKLFVITPYDQRSQRTVTRLWTRITTGS